MDILLLRPGEEYLCPARSALSVQNVQEWDLMNQSWATAGFMELWRMESSSSVVAGECGNWLHKSISAQNIPPHSGLQSYNTRRGQLKVTSTLHCPGQHAVSGISRCVARCSVWTSESLVSGVGIHSPVSCSPDQCPPQPRPQPGYK